MHGFSAHFQNAHARITFRKSFAFTSSKSGFLRGSRSKTPFFSRFKSLIWKSFAFTKGKIRLSNQERAESRSKTAFGMWFVPLWTGPQLCMIRIMVNNTQEQRVIHSILQWNCYHGVVLASRNRPRPNCRGN